MGTSTPRQPLQLQLQLPTRTSIQKNKCLILQVLKFAVPLVNVQVKKVLLLLLLALVIAAAAKHLIAVHLVVAHVKVLTIAALTAVVQKEHVKSNKLTNSQRGPKWNFIQNIE